jgi:hypothetical protein
MTEPTITCPNCRTEVKLTESLAAPLIEATRTQYEQKLAVKESEVAAREMSIRKQREDLAKDRESIDELVKTRLTTERDAIAAEESRKAKALLALDLDQKGRELLELNQMLQDRESKLAEAQKAQAEFLRKQRELDDAKREIDLTVESRVQEGLTAVRDKAKQEAEQGLKLKVLEKEEQIASMQRQIEDLKRRSEQGSQQLELEALICANFPHDIVEPVPKGEFGGDVLHRVVSAAGQPCGTILWEVKRTKKWSNAWLAKLRDDQRAAKADVAMIVTTALPEDVETFNILDGVWVTGRRCAIPVAIALRSSLIELAAARLAGDGQRTKAEMVYQYLTGPRFRHRIEAIVEKFTDMQADLDKERKLMMRMWAKREEQLRGVVESTAGMYGDLQGIAGSTLREIDALDIPLLESSAS